jgi:hypothetical protein
MKKDELEDELRPEYDLSTLQVRKLGPGRKSFGDVIKLEPDVAGAFPNADAVNEALRSLIELRKRIGTISDPTIATGSGEPPVRSGSRHFEATP